MFISKINNVFLNTKTTSGYYCLENLSKMFDGINNKIEQINF